MKNRVCNTISLTSTGQTYSALLCQSSWAHGLWEELISKVMERADTYGSRYLLFYCIFSVDRRKVELYPKLLILKNDLFRTFGDVCPHPYVSTDRDSNIVSTANDKCTEFLKTIWMSLPHALFWHQYKFSKQTPTLKKIPTVQLANFKIIVLISLGS